MSANNYQQYVPLKRVVTYFLDQYNLPHDEMDKAWVISFRALQDLNQQIAAEPKTLRIPVSGNKTVPFPVDYLSWTKIGILDANGEVSTLKINNAISKLNDNSPNRIARLTPDIANSLPILANNPIFYNYYYNGVYQTLYGVGGGLVQYGECTVDNNNRVIVLSPNFQYDSIILEYLSSPQDDNDYEVQMVLQEAIIAFIEWKWKLQPRELYYAAAVAARRTLPGKKVSLQRFAATVRESSGFYLKS